MESKGGNDCAMCSPPLPIITLMAKLVVSNKIACEECDNHNGWRESLSVHVVAGHVSGIFQHRNQYCSNYSWLDKCFKQA